MGILKIYEATISYAYSVASLCTIGLMIVWNRQDFEYGNTATMILGQNTAGVPDNWVQPIHRPRPQPDAPAADNNGVTYLTIMIEVGYAQSLLNLHQTAALYFDAQTTIQIVLTIKIFGVRTNNTIALLATLYLRTSPTLLIPTIVISFGTANIDTDIVNIIINSGVPPDSFIGVGHPDPNNNNIHFPPCNAANIPTYMMNIPGAELYYRVSQNLLPQGFAAEFNLDF